MRRALRSKSLRARLFNDYDGKCALCGVALGDDWHADHIVPWCKTGRTNVYEMQPTCSDCNLKKGSKMADYSEARRGFREIVAGTVELISGGRTTVSIVAPPRWGKSSLVRVIAHELVVRGLARSGLVLAPGTMIPKSIASRDKCNADIKRYKLTDRNAAWPEWIKGPPITKKALDGMYRPLLACSYQLMQHHSGSFVEWVDSMNHKLGVGPVVFCDEAHYLSESRAWGTTIRSLVEAGARLVLLTATPIRHDGEKLPGVEYNNAADSEYFKKLRNFRYDENGDRIADVYEGVKSSREIKADFTITFRDAWSETPQCIAFLSPVPVDIDVSKIISGSGETLRISQLGVTDTRRAISAIVRDRTAIGHMVDHFLRIHLPKSRDGLQGMIRCASRAQSEAADEEQIRIISEEIHRRTGRAPVVATMDSEDDAHATIDHFARGRGDILLVKGMGGVGLDFPNVKTLMDLSTTRSMASSVQFMLRGGMPESAPVFDYVYINDRLYSTIIDSVTDGGSLTAQELAVVEERKTGVQSIDSGSDDASRAEYSAQAAYLSDARDHHGHQANGEDMDLAVYLRDLFPEIAKSRTLPALAELIRSDDRLRGLAAGARNGAAKVGRAKFIENISPQAMRDEVYSRVKKIARLRGFPYVPKTADVARFNAYTRAVNDIYDQAFAMARVERVRSRNRSLMDSVTDSEAEALYRATGELLTRAEVDALDKAV